MAIDPRKLRPSELCRLLNSTPLGEVINERQLYRHRTRAGFRIGDGQQSTCSATWRGWSRCATSPRPEPEGDPYETLKERARARNAALSLAGRDIGELPEVVDPGTQGSRRPSNFRFFCESYFPLTFHLAWSPDHLKVIRKIEQAVLHGGLFAMAMPRGSGQDDDLRVRLHLGRALRPPGLRLPDRLGRRPRDGHARVDQDGTGRQRAAAGGLPGGRVSRSSAWTGSPTAAAASSTRASGRTSAGPPRRSCCRRCRAARPAGRSSRWPASRVASAA